MNAWDVDPKLQLSTYTEIGHKIALLFSKLRNSLARRVVPVRRRVKVKKQQAPKVPTRGISPYCCMTPFKELAENHRLYYPVPHVF